MKISIRSLDCYVPMYWKMYWLRTCSSRYEPITLSLHIGNEQTKVIFT